MNILLITIDSLRADFIGRGLTPNIDRLARESVVFESAFTHSPYTWGSFASLFTSRYPNEVTYPSGVLKESYPTLAGVLKEEGYTTIGVHSNPFLSSNFGYTRDFDRVKDRIYPWLPGRLPAKLHLELSKAFRVVRRQPYLSARETNREVFRQLEGLEEPFFLWVHYMDTHGPYQSRKGFRYLNKVRAERLWRKAVKNPRSVTGEEGEDLIERYKEEVSYLDKHIGELYDFLGERGLLGDTIITFCSDHGDGFYEHGFYSHPRALYEELVHVPLVMRCPGVEPGRVASPVGLVDVVPTVLGMAGIENDYGFEGEALLPGGGRRGFVVMDATPDEEGEHVAVRTEEWKLVVRGERKELYNMKEDLGEKVNVYRDEKEVVKRLEGLLMENYPERRESAMGPGPELDSEVKKRLEDLGYY